MVTQILHLVRKLNEALAEYDDEEMVCIQSELSEILSELSISENKNSENLKLIIKSMETLMITFISQSEGNFELISIKQSLENLKNVKEQDIGLLTNLLILKELGSMLINRGEYTDGIEYLQRGTQYFDEFEQKLIESPLSSTSTEILSVARLINIQTLSLSVHAYKQTEQEEKAVDSIVLALSRQTKLSNPLDWCENALKTQHLLVIRDRYILAQIFIGAVFTILEWEKSKNDPRYESVSARAYVEWGKFCYYVMERLENTSEEKNNVNIHFPLDPKVMETPRGPMKDYKEARNLYLIAQAAFKKATESYYTFEEHCLDYAEIVRCISSILRSLARFETNTKKQYGIHKKRAKLLDGVVEKLNPGFYVDECRQLWLDSGMACEDMLKLKQNTKFHNTLSLLAIGYYEKFIDSFSSSDIQKTPEGMEILHIYARIGGLYKSTLPPNDRFLELGQECFKKIYYFSDTYPDSLLAQAIRDSNKLSSEVDELKELLEKKISLKL